ncbi:hypothetical protein H112_00344 [Trichophyton rubrum D6]|uniref:Uncharacterized protein n=3 Tax=Trichophyton rubrum TaxID=5551 RepID=A0A178F7U4_TRIRU|nr:uncharacterized protein TERG_08272 [Trichophyton rubrum CBS 118892]EZF27665.1 hypothetical protein H100_00345 [Trichophyton rubrum MR850]EZF46645.1 hypothetical protein H102_00344 [Trichophyton rubrum CBS 100081]EZF57423.1 hypothetical protein H103_00343 [Trichophyton rubrum CBS 288.86]EZF67997.1 hypothetical protein H104_00343 [Trichophyton rubrum CBS 289.86]EZF89245.1 hypothetical protein H110_00347 [Trichophyton rubrum MR1448]EZG00019.1 hypothetical protein H113_00346 [Trichophyton rubr
MSQPVSARLVFLKASARLLSQQSPSTSAHLVTMHNSILLQDKSSRLPIKDQMEACPSCGSVRIPGVNSRVFTRTQTPPKAARSVHKSRPKEPSQGASQGQSEQKCLIYECLRCRHEVVQRIPQPARTIQRKRKSSTVAATSSSTSQEISLRATKDHAERLESGSATSKTDSENSSSKKRAKMRKQKGLLASLATQKQTKPSSSLNLLDFLQSS